MKLVLLVVAMLIAMVAAAPFKLNEDHYQFLFTRFVQNYNKQYETNDFFTRYNTFKANMNKVVAHNASGKSWTMGINKFADLSEVEFSQMLGFKMVKFQSNQDPEGPQCDIQASCQFKAKISDIDWRNYKGDAWVNKVKDQSQCGSCWAFSATQALESQVKIATGVLPRISEQQLVDCTTDFGEGGCDGGLMDVAYRWYAETQSPVCSEQSYPYTGRDGSCQMAKCDKLPVKVKGCTYTKPGVEGAVTQLQSGPIAVALAASFSMQLYSGGLFTDCSDKSLNHGVGLVGYYSAGTKFNQAAYVIRNSWGQGWGADGGYFYMDASQGKDCLGMDTTASNQDIMGNSQPIVVGA